ncbi:MAG: hypothetical protein RQ855_01560 [Desulfurococcales archaeon]|nr:hypothetical protein [Desulfurococcales archaeon]
MFVVKMHQLRSYILSLRRYLEHLDLLHKSVTVSRDTNLDNALKFYGGRIPYHEGALKYYREKDLLKS